MPTTKELAFRLEDRPGTIGKLSRALADRGVNILAFQAFPSVGQSLVRLVVDNPTTAKTVLDAERVTYTEVEVTRSASRTVLAVVGLSSEANININYAYCGVEPGANAPLLIFGVAEVGQAVAILDQTAAAAAGT
ncbi:MAG: amino acid-binding protein [Acidobacteria bacterium]|nr:MAG: amino acid-binding protein [Acidobacteriota bacterium]